MMNCPRCNVHIDEHPASPCLNAWVAEAVMGFKKYIFPGQNPKSLWDDRDVFDRLIKMGFTHKDTAGNTVRVPPFSTSIAAAWEVVKKLNQSGYIVEIINDCVAWSVVFHNIDTDERFTSDWKTSLEVQICRAAIKASQ